MPEIVGLDIGTTKICAVVGDVSESGEVEVVGIGNSKSTGMRKGVVVNIDQTAQSIRQAVEAAEQMSGRQITSVYAGIAGSHITSTNSPGLISVQSGIVTKNDVDRVIEAARSISMIPGDCELIHILPQEFIVDKQRGITEPVGMAGISLQVIAHVVYGSVSSVRNIVRACNSSSLKVEDLVLESLASADAVLRQEEREIGAALIDMGGGTTDIAIFANDAIKHTGVVPLGGQNLSNDIAFGLRTPIAAGEKIKTKYGCALVDMVNNDDLIEVPSVGGREPRLVHRRLLAEICEPRMAEMLTLADQIIERSGFKDKLGAGIVLTGGAALIEGCQELAEQIFNLPVRIGYPMDVGGLKDVVNSPKYSTAVGLLRYGAELEKSGQKKPLSGNSSSWFDDIMARIRKWFSEIT